MTVIAASTTYGIDTQIKKVQNYLNNTLSWTSPQIYGRIYRNQMLEGEAVVNVPEVFVSDNEYKQIFVDDTKTAIIGFYVTNRDVEPYRATVDVIFTGNLDGIYGSSSLRLDEKAIIEAYRTLSRSGLLQVQDVKIGIQQVFADFSIEKIRHRDMHPLFCFSYTCEMGYSEDFCK